MKPRIVNINLNGINIKAAPDPKDEALTILRVPVGPAALEAMNLHLTHIGVVPIEVQTGPENTLAIVHTNDYQAGIKNILTIKCLLDPPFGQTELPRTHPLATLPLFNILRAGTWARTIN